MEISINGKRIAIDGKRGVRTVLSFAGDKPTAGRITGVADRKGEGLREELPQPVVLCFRDGAGKGHSEAPPGRRGRRC